MRTQNFYSESSKDRRFHQEGRLSSLLQQEKHKDSTETAVTLCPPHFMKHWVICAYIPGKSSTLTSSGSTYQESILAQVST